MKALRSILILGATLGLLAASPRALCAEASIPDELQVRAAIVVNLVRFVTWPAARAGGPHSPIVVGLLGYDEQSAALEKYLNGHTVDGRAIQVRRIGRLERGDDCHLVYVASAERNRFDEIAGSLAAGSVLTISDDDTFALAGGIVGLPVIGDRIEIQINLAEAERSNLTISSRLLGLAKVIRKRTGK